MDCIKNATSDQLKKFDSSSDFGIQIDTACITDKLSKVLDQSGLKYKNNNGIFIIDGIKPDQGKKILQRVLTSSSDNSSSLFSTLLRYKKWVLIVLIALIVAGFIVYKYKFAESEEGFFRRLLNMIKGKKPEASVKIGGADHHKRRHRRRREPSVSGSEVLES